MNRDFVGTGYEEPTSYDVHVERDGERYSLMHKVGGILVDYRWDSGGPGTTDLARALLWEVIGVEPEWGIYRLFKNEVVSAWPRHAGECWRISEDEIRQWLAGVERDTAQTESAGKTKARLEQRSMRESMLKQFATMFRKGSE